MIILSAVTLFKTRVIELFELSQYCLYPETKHDEHIVGLNCKRLEKIKFHTCRNVPWSTMP